MSSKIRKVGVAIAGLGGYATGQVAPALCETLHCYLAGIISGNESSRVAWSRKYDIPRGNIYTYENFDEIANNDEIGIVYIALPHHLHAEYSIRALEAGKHVICEKPLAVSVEECDRMIAASKKAGRLLSVGYRLPFDPYHQEMIRLGRNEVYGKLKKISGAFGFVADPADWRWKKSSAGGGPLVDVGIYIVQAIGYISGQEPIAVTAKEYRSGRNELSDVEDSIEWQFEFASGLTGEGIASFTRELNWLKVEAENGMFELSPAYHYRGIMGRSPGGEMNFKQVNQQAAMIDAFALSVIEGGVSVVPGEMGRRDVEIMGAIYEAARTGGRVMIKQV